MLTKFTLKQTKEIKEYYDNNGYVIVSQLLQEKQLENFFDEYQLFKARPFQVFRSQDTNQAELLWTNRHGFLEHSILNPLDDLPFARSFAQAVESCFICSNVAEILGLLSGKDIHSIWQTMFFDKSTGTVAHQDHYYLDTEPPGNMIAAWFALEDIHDDAGCFFVVPGSHRKTVIENDSQAKLFVDHEDFVARTQQLIEKEQYDFKPCPLSKGDVLFWHPFLIHGAFENTDPRYSRKSLTAHYIPEGYGWRHKTQPPTTIPSKNPLIYFKKSYHYQDSLKWNIKRFYALYREYLVNLIKKRQPKMEMRSIKHKER
ncbi:MAG: phytanoyl-CoA dioxygenase family protein [Crocosphaera sp.]|nr:phytanoyl-CoA dioxygenase family protein [Crocosphaera sp.]